VGVVVGVVVQLVIKARLATTKSPNWADLPRRVIAVPSLKIVMILKR
jgi:hypothetical protein